MSDTHTQNTPEQNSQDQRPAESGALSYGAENDQSSAPLHEQNSSAPGSENAAASQSQPAARQNNSFFVYIEKFLVEIFNKLQNLLTTCFAENKDDIRNTANDVKGYTAESVRQSTDSVKGHIDGKMDQLTETQQKLRESFDALNGTFHSLESSINHPEYGITAQLVQKTKEQIAEVQKQVAAIWQALPELETRINGAADGRKQQAVKDVNEHTSGVVGNSGNMLKGHISAATEGQSQRLEEHIVHTAASQTENLQTQLNDAADRRIQRLQQEIASLIAGTKKLSEAIEQQLEGLARQNAAIPNTLMSELHTQIGNVTQLMNTLGADLQNRYERIVQEEQRINAVITDSQKELYAKIDETAKEEIDLSRKVINKIDEVYNGVIRHTDECQQQSNQKLEAILDLLTNQLERLKAEVQRLEEEKSILTQERNTARDQGEQLRAELERQKEHIAALTLQCNKMENECNEQKLITEPYSSFTPDYKKLLELSLQCESLHDLLDGIADPEKTEDMLKFLLVFGSEQSFALKVYTVMREYKKLHKEPLSDAERMLVSAINSFYRQNRQLEFDVFEIAESVGGVIKFDKNKMQDIDRPADTVMRSVEAIYVPTLRQDAAVIKFKAVVKGIK